MMNNEQKPQLTIPRVIGCLSFFNADNLEIMRGFADNEFDLAIVDPPYGIKASSGASTNGTMRKKIASGEIKGGDWDDKIPTPEYFEQLFRISKNQIIWGGNYFGLPASKCFLIWDKGESIYNRDFAECEMAWASFDKCARIFKKFPNQIDRIHPTQKPIDLYDWVIQKFAEPNAKILDTHLGSGSIAIAVERANRLDKMNLQFVGIEIDKEYFEKALNRIEQYTRQGTLSF
jgi:site-specific DNA-methyltransferase (adenine-specific)